MRQSAHAIAKSLRRKGQFAWVVRKVSPDEERRVRALDLKGIGFVKESRRFYPKRELLSHVLGYVGARRRRPGGHRVGGRLDHPGPPGQSAHPARRQAPRHDQPRRARADGRRGAGADDRPIPAEHRRAGTAEGRRGIRRRGRIDRRHGPARPARSSPSPTPRRSTPTATRARPRPPAATAPSRISTSPDRRSRSSPRRRGARRRAHQPRRSRST